MGYTKTKMNHKNKIPLLTVFHIVVWSQFERLQK